MAIGLEVLIILLLVVGNGVLSMSEMAIVSVRKGRLRQLAAGGDRSAQAALDLADSPTRFLSAVQIGITLVGILAGAFGGATLAEKLGLLIGRIPLLAPYGQAVGLALVVLGITYLTLVIGELAPKQVALNNAEKVALAVARPMRTLAAITSPLGRLLAASTEAVLRLVRAKPAAESEVTEDEVEFLIDEGTEVGVFEPVERDIVRRVFRLGDRKVGSLMRHRTEIVWLDLEDPWPEIVRQIAASAHTYFPVARGSLDNLLGIVLAKDLLVDSLAGQTPDLKARLHRPLLVPEGAAAFGLLERFKETKLPIALVIDEYGGIEGMLTLGDILEALVGEVPALSPEEESEAVQRPDGSWLLDGALAIDRFREIFGLGELPGEAEGHFETLGGFVMAVLGEIPEEADHFQWGNLCFEVMDMDRRRVDKVLVAPVKAPLENCTIP